MADDGGVAGVDIVEEDRLAHPLVRERSAAIKNDAPPLRALRNHPDLAIEREDVGVGEVPGFLEHRTCRPGRTAIAERHHRYAPALPAMVEVLNKDQRLAGVHDRKRVGIE